MLFKKLILIFLLFPCFAYSNPPVIHAPIEEIIPGFASGENSQAPGNKSTAIGVNSQSQASQSVAIGYNALAIEENTVSFGNKNDNYTSRLTNISEGKDNNDAINVSQAKKMIDKNKKLTDNSINQLKRTVTYDINTLKTNINDVNEYYKQRQATITDKIADLDKNIIALEKKVFAGIASTVAISSIPYLAHQTFSSGIGISNYRTGTAIAGGIQYKPTDDIAFRFNSSVNSEKEIIIGGGLAYGW